MDGQLLVVAALVAGAAAYLTRRVWRTWAGRSRGCGGCGSPSAAAPAEMTFVPVGQLRLRRRAAEEPRCGDGGGSL